MSDPWLLLLLFAAIAIGWILGRGTRHGSGHGSETAMYPQYYRGLNFLLNDQPDGALDVFIQALEVNSETLETHLAVGNLMRRKGEVERAIRIHQNLLARPSLPREHLHQAHLELARDFISAGLLDRAERLLEDLLREAPELRDISRRHLLEIYQDEKEWQKAIETGRQLLPRKSILKAAQPVESDTGVALAHYCCELAESVWARNDYHAVREYLKQALGYDRRCVRAMLLLAKVEYETGRYLKAIKALRRVAEQDPVFLSEAVDLLRDCYEKIGDPQGFHDFMAMALETGPSATILLALVEDIQAREGGDAAADFIGRELKHRPSLKGLAKLVELNIANSDGRARENLTILQLLIRQLLQNKPAYRCGHCGFSGKQLHWLCPGCKHWGQMRAIRGAEGE